MASGRALLGVKVTGDDFETAARAIRAGNWKGSIQAKDWVGIPIAKALDLKLTVKAEKAKVRGLIEIWMKAWGKALRAQPAQPCPTSWLCSWANLRTDT